MGWQEAFDRLAWHSRGSRGVFANMPSAQCNVKRIVKRVLDGTVSLPGKYSKLIGEAVLGYREEQLTLVGTEA